MAHYRVTRALEAQRIRIISRVEQAPFAMRGAPGSELHPVVGLITEPRSSWIRECQVDDVGALGACFCHRRRERARSLVYGAATREFHGPSVDAARVRSKGRARGSGRRPGL